MSGPGIAVLECSVIILCIVFAENLSNIDSDKIYFDLIVSIEKSEDEKCVLCTNKDEFLETFWENVTKLCIWELQLNHVMEVLISLEEIFDSTLFLLLGEPQLFPRLLTEIVDNNIQKISQEGALKSSENVLAYSSGIHDSLSTSGHMCWSLIQSLQHQWVKQVPHEEVCFMPLHDYPIFKSFFVMNSDYFSNLMSLLSEHKFTKKLISKEPVQAFPWVKHLDLNTYHNETHFIKKSLASIQLNYEGTLQTSKLCVN